MRHPERRFFANLDALRFLAFFAVFVSHVVTIAGPEVFAHPLHQRLLSFTHLGFLGVDFFFVLSSFLITWIVLEEYQHTGGFAVGRFWIRRTLRIWPLYFLIVLPVYSAKWLGWELLANQPDFVWAATFTLNFWMAAHGHQFLLALGVLWSISVEEQFYFAWALALKKAKRQLPLLSGLLIAVSLVATVLLRNQGDHPYFNTLPFLQHFGVGALVAWVAYHRSALFHWLAGRPRAWILLGYLAGLAALAAYRHVAPNSPLAMVGLRFAIVLFFAGVIFEQSFCAHSPWRLGGWRPLDYLGRISYGLYVYHGVAISLAIYLTFPDGAGATLVEGLVYYPLAILALTVGLAALSYEFFEKPFLRLKTRYYGDSQPAEAATPAVAKASPPSARRS